MKATEAGMLLTICAAYDNRKPDPDAAQAWALALEGLRFEDCREAIVGHYRKTRDWIMPSDVITGVRTLRHKRLGDFHKRSQLSPPPYLADNPRAEIDWFNRIYQRVMDGEITDPSQVDGHGNLKPRDVDSLGQIGREIPDEDTER